MIRPRNAGVSPSWMQHGHRIQLAERTLAADVGVDPRVGERGEVRAGRVLVEAVAADAGPRRVGVLIAVGRRRQRDVVQRRKLPPNPRAGIVLIGDRVDAQLRDERVELGRRLRRLCLQQRLRQRVRPAPREHPQRAGIGLLRRSNDQLGAGARSCRARPRPCRTRAGPETMTAFSDSAVGNPGWCCNSFGSTCA